jgi:hypothetical protein
MNNLLNPTTHTKKHHRLDPAEIIALAALSAVGAMLRNPRLANLDIPPAMRADEEGCEGRVEIFWVPRPDGTTETQVGGTIGYRSLVTHTYEFRSANGDLTPWESER